VTFETIIQSPAHIVIASSQRVGAERRPMTGSATKQSILASRGAVDCFASLAMTGLQDSASVLERHP